MNNFKMVIYFLIGFVCEVTSQTTTLNNNTTFVTANVVRGPYLQIGTPNSMIIKWRTDISCDSKLWYGSSVSTVTNQVSNATLVTDHEIKVTGLNAYTSYYYTIGTSSSTLLATNLNQYFKTSPVTGTKSHYKFWAVGDAGTVDTNAKAGFLNYIGNTHIDGWLCCF